MSDSITVYVFTFPGEANIVICCCPPIQWCSFDRVGCRTLRPMASRNVIHIVCTSRTILMIIMGIWISWPIIIYVHILYIKSSVAVTHPKWQLGQYRGWWWPDSLHLQVICCHVIYCVKQNGSLSSARNCKASPLFQHNSFSRNFYFWP